MAAADRSALLRLALMAACADPVPGATEQAQLRHVAEKLASDAGENLALVLREIMLGRTQIEDLAATLSRPEAKLVAYEIAVCICNADSAHSDAEHAFLERLRMALALDVRTARSFEREADAITAVPLQGDPSRPPIGAAHPVDEAALDRLVDDYAVLTAALASRAQPLALLATVPLDMKMLYRIGKHYGEELDRGQVRAFMATVGAEPVSQYVEACGRLIIAGAMDRPSTQAASGDAAAESCYAKTLALGQLARLLKVRTLEPAELQERYAASHTEGCLDFASRRQEVADRARQTAVNDLLTLVKQ